MNPLNLLHMQIVNYLRPSSQGDHVDIVTRNSYSWDSTRQIMRPKVEYTLNIKVRDIIICIDFDDEDGCSFCKLAQYVKEFVLTPNVVFNGKGIFG